MSNLAHMSEYRVLARKYRPQTFEDLVGQEVLVRTLTNAIALDRIAHAFVLTGIRGIGKTTTARIMAKALNCIGENGDLTKATITPCGVCTHCQQIRDDRHVDVLELDAASHTGVNDMREIIDSSRYRPASGRYKVYIIDEAHMLSNSAFNALLKTLEEPPAHVVFIFATTEIRKIPVTILSRCQRFDLRRLTTEEMATHLSAIASKEQIGITPEAAELIAIASEGSVRDGLSLMDQAISHSELPVENAALLIHHDIIRQLLGLVDRTRLYTMLEALLGGNCHEALTLLRSQYHDGANMATLVQDMMQAIHSITRLIVTPAYQLDSSYADHEKQQLHNLAEKLSVASVTRAWQMLLKGLEEIKRAPDPLIAAEMLFIRFAYASSLPDPGSLIKKWQESGTSDTRTSINMAQRQPVSEGNLLSLASVQPSPQTTALATKIAVSNPVPVAMSAPLTLVTADASPVISRFEDIIALCEEQREAILVHHLKTQARVVGCQSGELVLSATQTLDNAIIQKLKSLLLAHTSQHWNIRFEHAEGADTLQQQANQQKQQKMQEALSHPLVSAILNHFEDSTLVDIIPSSHQSF